MKITYFALKTITVAGTERQPGDLVPEAATWNTSLRYELSTGSIFPVLVSTLPEEVQQALAEWEKGEGPMAVPESEALKSMQAPGDVKFDEEGKETKVPDSEKPQVNAAAAAKEATAATNEAKAAQERADVATKKADDAKAQESKSSASKSTGSSDDDDSDESYDANTVAELKTELDHREIEYSSSDKKDDLIKLLEDDDKNVESEKKNDSAAKDDDDNKPKPFTPTPR